MLNRIVLLTVMFGLFSANADPLPIGSKAPVLTVTTSEDVELDLSSVYEKGPVLVYFYPKADTPGCTAQACNLRDSFEELSAEGIEVVGVSTDNVKSQAAFKEKYSLPFTLVADSDSRLVDAFGVPTRIGFASRQSFLIIDGKVAWRDLKAKPKTQAEEALAALKRDGER
ncbi:MAG: peroxiredoxin [Verrucomicrobiota bacterium]